MIEDIPVLNEAGNVSTQYICKFPTNIRDLSTSLLGKFEFDHTQIKLTPKGIIDFGAYCDPDHDGIPLIVNDDYESDGNRLFWLALYQFMGSLKITVIRERKGGKKDEYKINSFIKHTPAKWNFWHHSVRWETGGVEINEDNFDKADVNAFYKQIGAKLRSVIAENAKTDRLDHNIVQESCYTKAKQPSFVP